MKILKILLGPELCWIILYGLALGVARANKKSSFAYDAIIENVWFYIPLISVMIFGLYWVPIVEKNWLLLRIWIAGIIMGHFVLETMLASYSQQGPGIGMGYLAGIILLFILLVVGSIIVKLVF
jgi:hypothetical protein